MIKFLIWTVTILGGTFLVFSLYVYLNQHKMVFVPSKNISVTPDQLNLAYEEINILVSKTEKIICWYLPAQNQSDSTKTVLFCQGNGGNISHRLLTAEFFVKRNINILLLGYRGYGESDGKPSEQNIYEDARAGFDWLVNEKSIDKKNIIIFGRSLGGVPAIDLAMNVDCKGLIVESSFTSAVDMGKIMFPMIPIGLLMRYKLNSIDKIDKVNCPVLITHSKTDEMIPFSMSEQLYEKANEPKKFFILEGGHNDRGYLDDPSYQQAILDIIN